MGVALPSSGKVEQWVWTAFCRSEKKGPSSPVVVVYRREWQPKACYPALIDSEFFQRPVFGLAALGCKIPPPPITICHKFYDCNEGAKYGKQGANVCSETAWRITKRQG